MPLQPATLPIPLRRNAVEPMRLQLFGLDDMGNEVPLDIGGRMLKMDVRLYPGQPGEPKLTLSTGAGINVINATTGIVEIDWPGVRDTIAALPTVTEPGYATQSRIDTFAYDLLLIAENGDAQAILEGIVPVSFGVTTA